MPRTLSTFVRGPPILLLSAFCRKKKPEKKNLTWENHPTNNIHISWLPGFCFHHCITLNLLPKKIVISYGKKKIKKHSEKLLHGKTNTKSICIQVQVRGDLLKEFQDKENHLKGSNHAFFFFFYTKKVLHRNWKKSVLLWVFWNS